MTTVLLLRHGRTVANAEAVLAGWTPGIELDDVGRDQTAEVAARLQEVRYSAILTSPLERCRQTADIIAGRRRRDLPIHAEIDLAECRYGDWTGQPLEVLAKDPLWEAVQSHPSAVAFPGGESLAGMQARAIGAIRRWNDRLGPAATYVVVSHGDVIKSVLADALGMHLDMFQRIQVDPCSVSVVRYLPQRSFVARMNDVGGDLSMFSPDRRTPARAAGLPAADAVVGGDLGA